MTVGRKLLNILNAINAIVLVILVLKFLTFFTFLNAIGFLPTLIVLCLIFFAKNWVITKYSERDPLRVNKITNALYNFGMGLIALAILFKIMHWPYFIILMLLATLLVVLSYILSFVLPPDEKEQNQEILDDII